MMKLQIKTFFSDNYNSRYYHLLWIQLILLFLFRIFTLISTTKNLTNLPFFTPDQLLIGFSILELVLVILFITRIPKKVQNQNLFLFLLVVLIFFLILYIEQYILPNNPFQFYSDDFLFVAIQLLIILILIIVNKNTFDLKNDTNILTLLLFISFTLLLISKLIQNPNSLMVSFIIFSTIIFWGIMWLSIIKFTIKLFPDYNWKIYLPLILGLLMAIGMYMGMMKSLGTELGKTVFITIIDQSISLFSVNISLFGFNPEELMIIINLISGYCFLFMLLTVLLFKKSLRDQTVLILIIGVTGLASYPLLGLIRYLALYKLASINEKIGEIKTYI